MGVLLDPQFEEGIIALTMFAQERRRIYIRRFIEKTPPPWTSDPILLQYKFCNVYRELDRVSIWVREHIREPFAEHPLLWFMLAAARQINWPDTLEELIADRKGAWPHNPKQWDYTRLAQILLDRKARGDTVYTGSYMLTCRWPLSMCGAVSAERQKSKCWYTAEIVLNSLWIDRAIIEKELHDTLSRAHAILLTHQGWGDFLAAQVVADLKYTRYLKNAPDWWDWAVLGPGSRRGLNRVFGRESIDAAVSAGEAVDQLSLIRDYLGAYTDLPRLCLQDTQNVCCEFDKYERTRLGEGRPRLKFRGGVIYD